ncbi:hypothetical protein CWC25_12935, partial [Pseudoalteromonas sp. S4389]
IISHLEQLNNEIFALLSTRFYCLKIVYLIKRIGIKILSRHTLPSNKKSAMTKPSPRSIYI